MNIGDDATLNTYISIDGNREKVWFKVNRKFGQYLCDERGAAYLVAVLHYAITIGHDIELDVPVTEKSNRICSFLQVFECLSEGRR